MPRAASVVGWQPINFDRWLLAPTIHGLFRISDTWFVTSGIGIQYESGIRLQGNGVLAQVDPSFRHALGPSAEIGMVALRRIAGVSMGFDLALRRTLMTYTANSNGKDVNANSTAVVLGIDFYL